MNKRIPTLLTSALLAIPGGALLAAGQVAQQTPNFEFNRDLVNTIVNFVGALLLVGLPVITRQLLSLRSEVKTAQTSLEKTKETTVSTTEMEKVQSDLALLQETVQSLKDDLRVTTSERDTAYRERDNYRKDNAALIEQLEDERKTTASLSRRCDDLETTNSKQQVTIDQLEARVVAMESVKEFANLVIEAIKELAKVKTGEHTVIVDNGDKGAAA